MAQPMIIPGKKRPAGTQTPYVTMVKKYQVIAKMNKCQLVELTPLGPSKPEMMVLIASPSVFMSIVPMGL